MEELIAKLKAVGVAEDKVAEIAEKAKADGATDLAGAALLTESDWTGYGLSKVAARKLVADLTKPASAPAPAAAPVAAQLGQLLPSVPADEAFLAQLQVGGTAKMSKTDVMAAVRALFADRFGVYDIDDRLLEAIATRSTELDEPYPELYYEIEASKSAKKHAEVLKALKVPGRFVTESRKKQFIGKMQGLWPILVSFQGQLDAWYTGWTQKAANPAMLISAFASMAGGGAPMPGMMEPPDTSPVLDAATGVIDQLNKLFAGPGIPVARALAADAVEYQQLLKKSELAAAIGASTPEEMLKKLDLAVTADFVRAERSAVQYVLGIMEISTVSPNQLPLYIGALKELGATIPWDRLASGGVAPRAAARAGSTGRGTY